MKVNNIDASRLGYGKIYLPFSVDIPDEQYWRYTETDQNYAILVEAVLKFKEICERQKESIEKKKKIINNFYSSSNFYREAIDTIDAYRNYVTSDSAYVTTGSARAQAFNDFITAWEDDTKSTENNLETKEEKETNETTAFTSGEISW